LTFKHSWLITPRDAHIVTFTIVDNTYGMTTVALGWQQLWSEDKVEQEALLLFETKLYLRGGGAYGAGSDCGNRISCANFLK